MPEQDLIQIVEERLAAFAARDWERYQAGMAPDAVYTEAATGRRVQGPEQIVAATRGWVAAFPDLKATVAKTLACGNQVVLELTWAGTHTGPLTGPFGPIPPTGKVGTVEAVQVVTVENGLVKEVHQYFDLRTILQQIGAVPLPAAAAAR